MSTSASIVCVVKNRVATIRRCVESILEQDAERVECVVQDGASTDGTLQILQEYGSRIALESAPDAGATHALYRAIARTRGDVVGSCMSDERLLPGALQWGVSALAHHPGTAAVYGAVRTVDANGRQLGVFDAGEFDFGRLLAGEMIPPFTATFFRGEAAREIVAAPFLGAGDFEFWVRFASRFQVERVSGQLVADYGLSPSTLSNSPQAYQSEYPARVRFLSGFLDGGPPSQHQVRQQAIASCHVWYAANYLRLGDWPSVRRCLDDAWAACPAWRPATLVPAGEEPVERHGRTTSAHEQGRALSQALAIHLAQPSPRTLEPLFVDRPPAERAARHRWWLSHLVEPVCDIWFPLRQAGVERAFVLGAEGAGRALARDLERTGIRVTGVIENNERVRASSPASPPCFPLDSIPPSASADVIVSSILGEHDRTVLPALQVGVEAAGLPLVSWKTVLAIAARRG